MISGLPPILGEAFCVVSLSKNVDFTQAALERNMKILASSCTTGLWLCRLVQDAGSVLHLDWCQSQLTIHKISTLFSFVIITSHKNISLGESAEEW